jgi:DivIVA domain-containing protein
MEQVDGFLDAVRDTFLGVRQPPLTAEEIRAKQFATTRFRPGYDEEEVDAYLDDVEARLRARCAECGAETGGAVQACAVCGAPAAGRPSTAVDATLETCLTCGTVTAEHLPGCPAEAAVNRARRWRGAAGLALLATGALLAVVGKVDHLHGRWVIVAGWVMVGCAAILGIAELWSEERGRGPLLPKWLRVVTVVLLVYGFALLITQSHGGGGGGGGG